MCTAENSSIVWANSGSVTAGGPDLSPMAITARTGVVTGAGNVGQIADAVARAFAARGAGVVLVGRDAARVAAHAAALTADGHQATHHAADLTDERALSA